MTRAEARRERVVLAARKLFTDNGFHNTGIAQIARESDVLVGQLYRDFSSKEEIVIAIVERDMRDFLPDAELAAALDADDHDAIRRWIARFVACEKGEGEPDRRLIAEIVAEASRSPRVAEVVTRIHDTFRSHLLTALERLAPGESRAARREMLAEVVMTVSSGVFHRRLTQGEAMTDEVVSVLVDGVLRRIDAIAAW